MSTPRLLNAVIAGLTGTRADGLACVVCGAHYLVVRLAHVPVGRSITGSQVSACVGSCATGEPTDGAR